MWQAAVYMRVDIKMIRSYCGGSGSTADRLTGWCYVQTHSTAYMGLSSVMLGISLNFDLRVKS